MCELRGGRTQSRYLLYLTGMADIFKFFKESSRPTYLGVDIGTTSIKVVEVARGERLPQVVNYGFLDSGGYLSRANQALQTSTLKLFDREAVELLRLILKEMKDNHLLRYITLIIISIIVIIYK